jgi:tetratricopeptide (TPR) repeat protein
MKRIHWILAALLLGSPSAWSATVKVLMTDSKGTPLPGVEAKLTPTSAGFDLASPAKELFGNSAASGEILIPEVADGTYFLKTRMVGFASGEAGPIAVSGADLSLTMKMLTQPEVEKMIQSASNAFKKKKFEEAAAQYKELLACFANDPTLLGNMARSLLALNQLAQALDYAKRAIQLDPERFKALEKDIVATATYEAGKKSLAGKSFAKAAEQFSESVKSDPTYAPAFYGLALSFANLGKYPQALENVQKALELDPGNSEYKGIEERLKAVLGQGAQK